MQMGEISFRKSEFKLKYVAGATCVLWIFPWNQTYQVPGCCAVTAILDQGPWLFASFTFDLIQLSGRSDVPHNA